MNQWYNSKFTLFFPFVREWSLLKTIHNPHNKLLNINWPTEIVCCCEESSLYSLNFDVGHRGNITYNKKPTLVSYIFFSYLLTDWHWKFKPKQMSETIQISGATASNETWIFDDCIGIVKKIPNKDWINEEWRQNQICTLHNTTWFHFEETKTLFRLQQSKNKNRSHCSYIIAL